MLNFKVFPEIIFAMWRLYFLYTLCKTSIIVLEIVKKAIKEMQCISIKLYCFLSFPWLFQPCRCHSRDGHDILYKYAWFPGNETNYFGASLTFPVTWATIYFVVSFIYSYLNITQKTLLMRYLSFTQEPKMSRLPVIPPSINSMSSKWLDWNGYQI